MDGGSGGSSLLSESDDCGRVLLRLLSRGHAVAAELQRVADALPPALAGEGPEFARLGPVLKDFSVFHTPGAVERVATTPELLELDEESEELHLQPAKRIFRLLAAIRKYAADLRRFLDDLESGLFVSHSLEEVACDADGAQLLSEAVALLGALLLLLDERLPGPARERALVVFYRFTVGTNDEAEEYPDVCRLFSSSGRPADADLASRPLGYPESFFARFPLPREVIRMVVGQMQSGDIYGAAKHYPLPQHRSHSLSAQAGLLYVVLFFDNANILQSDAAAMREIVNRHFGDAWVVAYALGFTADLLAMWAPYPAARQALAAAITPASVRQLQDLHVERLTATRQQLAEHLKEGGLTEEVILQKTSQLLSCLRQANTSIRWLLLQPTTRDPKLQAVLKGSGGSASVKEGLLEALVDTALLEDRVRSLLGPLVARRDADWAEQQAAASQSMDDLAVYFSGEHALRRNVKNKELEEWFRGLQQRIDDLSYSTQEETLGLSRKVSQLCRALEEVEAFYEISQQPHILHFLADARARLQRMVRTVSLSEDTFQTIATVADLSYAWKALGAYKQTMHALLAKSSGSVKGLRALFLKLASILEAPLRRIRQAGNTAHEELVSSYYSLRLEDFMRSVLQEIPRVIFRLLAQLSETAGARLPEPLPSRMPMEELWAYVQKSEEARHKVTVTTQKIAQLVRGMREADVAVLGAVRVEPRSVLAEGLRRELASQLSALLAGIAFPGRSLSRRDVAAPLEGLASKADLLRRSFERVQDYLGVSALRLWHQELGRSVRFMLHMEQHALLRRRLPAAKGSRFHDPVVPIAFPDGAGGGGSFISRTAGALAALTDPKVAVGGLHGEWRSAASGELLLDGALLEALYRALGPFGLAALSRYLGLRAARHAKEALAAISAALPDARGPLQEALAQARSVGGGKDAVRTLRSATQRLAAGSRPLVDALASLGQHQLLRRRLHYAQQLHVRLDAPVVAEALKALDGAGLAEAVDAAAEQAGDGQLESLAEFVGEGPSREAVSSFHRKIASAVELPGFGNPLRQIYLSIPTETVPPLISEVLALTLLANVPAAPRKQKSTSRGLLRGMLKSSGGNGGSAPSDHSCCEAASALVTGFASLLQQLPRARLDGMLALLGEYLASLCAEAADAKDAGKESWAEGARLLELLGELLELLGLPREHLAQFAPLGMLDLWPAE